MEQTILKIAAEVALAFSCPERRSSSFSDRCKANARRNKFPEWRSLAGGSAPATALRFFSKPQRATSGRREIRWKRDITYDPFYDGAK